MSLSTILPKPKHSSLSQSKWAIAAVEEEQKTKVPKYLKRASFIPQTLKDFGDGGAFPEINILQYPLDMGRKKAMGAETSDTIPLQTDSNGNIRYDLVLREGETNVSKMKHVHHSLQDLKDLDGQIEPRPDPEQIQETTKKTQDALDKLVQGTIVF
jgi:SNW domain-containing protein 1